MNLKTVLARTATGVLSLAMLTTSGGLALAVAGDYAQRDHVPGGVSVGDVDISGLTPAEVREAVERSIVEPLTQTMTVRAGDRTFDIDPEDYISVDVDSAVNEAYEPNRASTIAHRTVRLAAGTSVGLTIEPAVAVDRDALARTVTSYAAEVDTAAVDALIEIENGVVVVRPSAEGLQLDQDAAVEALASAMLDGETRLDLPTLTIRPEIAEEDLGQTIVVRLGSRTLELWEGTEIDRTYRVAIGKPGHSTPRGSWEITAKRYMPSWGNPGSAWAADMPATIPPGPSNPLGTRAMNLNVSGIRIHGTSNVGSIGTAASHGCVRMVRRDVEALYDLVEVGTKVLIVSQ